VAIATVQAENVHIDLPNINEADFGFKPDQKNHRIIFGLKGINSINTELSQAIITNRPYTSMDDFCTKMIDSKIIKTSQMIQLIKGGCFTEIHSKDRRATMDWFLKHYVFTPCEKLTMQQFSKMQELEIIPQSLELSVKMVSFKKYVLNEEGLYEKHIDVGKKIPKRGYHDGYYILDNNSQPFFEEHFSEESIVDAKGSYYIISEKKFKKEADSKIQPLKNWFDKETTLNAYNEAVYNNIWKQYADGSLPAWSMKALSYYDQEHELEHVNEPLYGIVNFNDLPEEPEVYDYYTRYINGEPKQIPKYKIVRIAGTILNTDNNRHMVALLTKYGLVNVKFNKGHYAFYGKQISVKVENSDKKKILEKSWLVRGNKIAVAGIRRGDQFWPMIYKDTIYKHTVNLIKELHDDGTLLLQAERVKV
jgi:DNA polymerase-3 subunit alpha